MESKGLRAVLLIVLAFPLALLIQGLTMFGALQLSALLDEGPIQAFVFQVGLIVSPLAFGVVIFPIVWGGCFVVLWQLKRLRKN